MIAHLIGSVKIEFGTGKVVKEGRYETMKKLAKNIFCGSGKYCISKSDKQVVWLGDSTNQLWKIDETKESHENGAMRRSGLCPMVSYLPKFRHYICAQTPGGTIYEYNKALKDISGEDAPLIEKSPALAICFVSLCTAGNGFTYKKPTGVNAKGEVNAKKLFAGISTIDDTTKEEYAKFHRYLKAFPSACVYGFGTKAIYGPPGESEYSHSYRDMITLLQVLHSDAPCACDSRVQLAKMTKTKEPDWKYEDKFHGGCEFKNSLVCGKMNQTMMNLTTAVQEIINLGEVYKEVCVDNPMGAYTTKIAWQAQDSPATTFGEPFCESCTEGPVIEECINNFVIPDKWTDRHDRRKPITQKFPPPGECLGKSRHTFVYQPMISHQDHSFVTGKLKSADTWAQLQKSLDPQWIEASGHAMHTHVLDQMWGVCQRGDESKPYRKRSKSTPAKDAVYYCPADFERMIRN